MADWEQEAAFQTAAFLRREFGLCPHDAEAERSGEVLAICLLHALSPLGCLLARTPEGVEALGTAYTLMHETHQASLESLISQIAGQPACQSRLKLDCGSGTFWLSFRLTSQAKKASQAKKEG